jgi:ribosome-associated protein
MARYDSSAMQPEFVSKTRRKEAMLELQELGAALVALSAAQLASMDLPEALEHAVREAQRIVSHEAKRRQLQLVGRLMRALDATPIREQLAAVRGESAAARARHRRLEQWRDRLLADDAVLTGFAREFPAADLQAIRVALRNTRREQAEGRPPRAYRQLFRLLRDAGGTAATREAHDAT